jgi:cyclic pyranopterin phosphate synthase
MERNQPVFLEYNQSMKSNEFTHLDSEGNARMVDIGDKPITERIAIAKSEVILNHKVMALIHEKRVKKGDVFTIAEIAGIQASKKTYDLIPLCHPILIQEVKVSIQFLSDESGLEITASVKSTGQTGAEMEALTAVSVAALTVYDMIKAVQKDARIQNTRLVEKHGGMSGDTING